MEADKEQIYDRQLRLWGRDAQSRLCASVVLILGVTLSTTEAAKNMILAGINIIIVDDGNANVDGKMLYKGTSDCNLSTHLATYLREMNPLVKIDTNSEADLLSNNFEMIKKATAVVLDGLNDNLRPHINTISKVCSENQCLLMMYLSFKTLALVWCNCSIVTKNEENSLEYTSIEEALAKITLRKKSQTFHTVLSRVLIDIAIYKDESVTSHIKNECSRNLIEEPIFSQRVFNDMFIEPKNSDADGHDSTDGSNYIIAILMENKSRSYIPVDAVGGGIICQEVTKFLTEGKKAVKYHSCLISHYGSTVNIQL